jgi:hypothetical protein
MYIVDGQWMWDSESPIKLDSQMKTHNYIQLKIEDQKYGLQPTNSSSTSSRRRSRGKLGSPFYAQIQGAFIYTGKFEII